MASLMLVTVGDPEGFLRSLALIQRLSQMRTPATGNPDHKENDPHGCATQLRLASASGAVYGHGQTSVKGAEHQDGPHEAEQDPGQHGETEPDGGGRHFP